MPVNTLTFEQCSAVLNDIMEQASGQQSLAAVNTSDFVSQAQTALLTGFDASAVAGIGAGGEGYTTFTIAGPTGEGLTSARSFTRQRRCVLVDSLSII